MSDPTPAAAIDAFNRVYGRHPGYRALHAKGTVLTGTFIATPEASGLSRAGHLQGSRIPATVRFSNGSGDPNAADWRPDARGMAIKFDLPDGSQTDIVTATMPRSPVRTVRGFIELLQARSGPGAIYRVPRFLAEHPESIPALGETLRTMAPPASYAGVRYYGLHAFRWQDAGGGERHVRYHVIPEQPTGAMTPWEARAFGPDYLQKEIVTRVAERTVSLLLVVQIAEPGDPVDDSSARWPRRRRRVAVGRLELLGTDTTREGEDRVLVFDPTRVTDGIECSADPLLRYRSRAYAESVARRTRT